MKCTIPVWKPARRKQYMDIKIADNMQHKNLCWVSNDVILRNFIRLNHLSAKNDFVLLPRTPLIPGMTDGSMQIKWLIEFYVAQDIEKAALMDNNPIWIDKCDQLGIEAKPDSKSPLRQFYDQHQFEAIKSTFAKHHMEIVDA